MDKQKIEELTAKAEAALDHARKLAGNTTDLIAVADGYMRLAQILAYAQPLIPLG